MSIQTREPGIDVIQFGDIPDFEVSWAGQLPFGVGFAFGSEDGRILFTDETANPYHEPIPASEAGEAINGLAAYGVNTAGKGWTAASTRADLCLWRVTGDGQSQRGVIHAGTHGIIGTPSGYFVGPQGLRGLLILNPATGKSKILGITGPDASSVYFYKVAVLQDAQGSEVFACAARRLGVAATRFEISGADDGLQTFGYKDWDVVDICGIHPNSHAAVALGKDGTIRLFKNVLSDRHPRSVRFSTVTGVAYRLLSCRGHLYVLTSSGIHILFEVAGKFIRDELKKDEPTLAMSIPLEAVDANLHGDKYLLVVNSTNEIIRIDIATIETMAFHYSKNTASKQTVTTVSDAIWDRPEIPQATQSEMAFT